MAAHSKQIWDVAVKKRGTAIRWTIPFTDVTESCKIMIMTGSSNEICIYQIFCIAMLHWGQLGSIKHWGIGLIRSIICVLLYVETIKMTKKVRIPMQVKKKMSDVFFKVFFTTEFELQSVRLVLSVTPGSCERPKGMSLFYITGTCFYVGVNTKCQYVFDHTLKRVLHDTQRLCTLTLSFCLWARIGRESRQDQNKRRGKERHWRQALHQSDRSHEFFCVISKETRSGMVSKYKLQR